MRRGLQFFIDYLDNAAERHDFDKIEDIDFFHEDFLTGFAQTGWWDNHRRINRHHLAQEDGVPKDVNLLDVLEYITDCVMAGMARSGSVYDLTMPPELLERAFKNTVELLKAQVVVFDANDALSGGDMGNMDDAMRLRSAINPTRHDSHARTGELASYNHTTGKGAE